jgi:hypothetical protein
MTVDPLTPNLATAGATVGEEEAEGEALVVLVPLVEL